MSRIYIYADESGNFAFNLHKGASRYFVLTTVTFFDDRKARLDLEEMRHQIAWNGGDLPDYFHASENRQDIRDQVFDVLKGHAFRVDATIMEKRKAQPQVRVSEVRFYKHAWYYHMKHILPSIAKDGDEVLVIVSSIGTKKKREGFRDAVSDIVNQMNLQVSVKTTHWSAASDLGLQIADYCCWAIFRKWESGDSRSYVLIKDKIHREHDLFGPGTQFYY